MGCPKQHCQVGDLGNLLDFNRNFGGMFSRGTYGKDAMILHNDGQKPAQFY